jgi:hypothetical protein
VADAAKAKVGPFTGRQWLIGGVGAGVLFFGYRWWRNRQAGAALGASTALAGGTTIPPGQGQPSQVPQTLSEWEQAALGFGGIPTLNAWNNWIAGNCVDQGGYNGLQAAITALGLPPGISSFPVLSVCAGPTSAAAGGSNPSGSQQNTTPVLNPITVTPTGAPIPLATYFHPPIDPTTKLPVTYGPTQAIAIPGVSAPVAVSDLAASTGNINTLTEQGATAQANYIAQEAAIQGPEYVPPGTGGKPSYYYA